MAKIRLDVWLVDNGLVESRSRAQCLVMDGKVLVNDRPVTKPGTPVPVGANVRLRDADHPWVSRGGLKLAHALREFGLDPAGAIAADIGASTGGFTNVMLHHGAARVYAVDVGHGQLAWKLRTDPRVVVMEKTNARHLTAGQVPEPLDYVVCDASFIGLSKVLPAVLAFVKPGGQLVALIKPQFEAGPEDVEKGGVVRDPAVHQRVCDQAVAWLGSLPGWRVAGLMESPVKGPEGNREFLLWGQFLPAGSA